MKRIELLIIVIEIIIISIFAMLIGLYYDKNKVEEDNVLENIANVQDGITYEKYNEVSYKSVSDAQMSSIYFNSYKEKLIYSYKEAYDLLDKDYKAKKFKTIESFEDYIQNNKVYIFNMYLVDYMLIKDEDYNIYHLKDQYGNVYVLKETAMMEYSVQLDNYTIDNKELNEKYESFTYKDKGIYNIDKFFSMVNTQDYEAAYNVLDENFKQNYFKTQADFENYMKDKVFRYNKVNYKEYSNKITDVYTYKIILTDAEEVEQGQTEFNIVIKLLEGTNFVMSFSVN